MSRARLLFLTAIIALAIFSPRPAPAQGTRPIDRFAWLVGGVWKADATSLGQGMKEIETRYSWSPNKAYIEFETTFTSNKGSLINYSGMLFNRSAADAAAAYEMWYMDAGNAIVDGAVTVDAGDNWSLTFKSGSSEYRVDIVRGGTDQYRWNLSARTGSSFSPVFSLEYKRTP